MIETPTPDLITEPPEQQSPALQQLKCYAIQFRKGQHQHSASSRIQNLTAGEVVMTQVDHGLEPAKVIGPGLVWPNENDTVRASFTLVRRCNREEMEKFENLVQREADAYVTCKEAIGRYRLMMKLISVERYFNGSKIIFYFTAESRVDFRELVKDLVQEFRTRVEMRQIGVRHETKMVGGLGCCGRELCCSSYLKNFAPVSIKMAKEQDLPLNPTKISGICDRLLCCLTYEFPAYHEIKKNMPRLGHTIKLDNRTYKVLHHNVVKETITVGDVEDLHNTLVLTKTDWQKAPVERGRKGKKGQTEKEPADDQDTRQDK